MSVQSCLHHLQNSEQNTTQISCTCRLFSYRQISYFSTFQPVLTLGGGRLDGGKLSLKINSLPSNVIHMSTNIHSTDYRAFNKYSVTRYAHTWSLALIIPQGSVLTLFYFSIYIPLEVSPGLMDLITICKIMIFLI